MRRLISSIFASLVSSSAVGDGYGFGTSHTGFEGSIRGAILSPGRTKTAPVKEKSVVSDDDSHGTCSPRVALTTPVWVLRSVCSAPIPGARISRNSSVTKTLWSLRLLETTEPSAEEYSTSEFAGVTAGASPA